jgi:hypothetical protein|tara:strand:+ start:2175 stop:2612 length:438 start_codon:yes stop_codon:yes gene_type:complete
MIEDIISSWREDCKLDDTELDTEALRIPNLHAKYLKMLAENRVKLRALRIKQKQLSQTLYDYYKGDLNNPEDLAAIKREPWPKTVLKQDMPMYVDSDEDMVKMNSKIAMQEEIVGVCEEILKSINNRGFQIKNAIDWRRLTNFGT